MYYSHFEISADLARNPYLIHGLLWEAFSRTGAEKRDFLFRVQWPENRSQQLMPYYSVLVQSQTAPTKLVQEKGFLKTSKEVNLSLQAGQLLRFALCANPVKRLSKERNRVPLLLEEQQFEWLERHFEGAVQLQEAQIVKTHSLYFRKEEKVKDAAKKLHRGKLYTVTFDGILEIKDSVRCLELIQKGIGPAKAFGCGLLTLARI